MALRRRDVCLDANDKCDIRWYDVREFASAKRQDSRLHVVASLRREGARRRGHYGRSGWLMDSPFSPLSNFRAVTLRIKGWVVSGQLGRRRDPRVRLEQPPFVRGITSAKEEKNISMPAAVKGERRRRRIRKITNRAVFPRILPRTDNNVGCFCNVVAPLTRVIIERRQVRQVFPASRYRALKYCAIKRLKDDRSRSTCDALKVAYTAKRANTSK